MMFGRAGVLWSLCFRTMFWFESTTLLLSLFTDLRPNPSVSVSIMN